MTEIESEFPRVRVPRLPLKVADTGKFALLKSILDLFLLRYECQTASEAM